MAQASSSAADVPVEASPSSPTTQTSDDAAGSSRLRAISTKLKQSNPPLGMWSATAHASSKAPTLREIRRGSYGHAGWDAEGQQRQRENATNEASARGLSRKNTQTSIPGSPLDKVATREARIEESATEGGLASSSNGGEISGPAGSNALADTTGNGKGPAAPSYDRSDEKEAVRSDDNIDDLDDLDPRPKPRSKDMRAMLGVDSATRVSPRASSSSDPADKGVVHPNQDGYYPNGYHFPGKKTWKQSTWIGIKALWKFTLTPLGFLIVLYGLNVVAWGGMLFLLLCNAAPAMCYPPTRPGVFDCNDIDSPRRVWVEVTSQVLNGLFCVTGFGLIPWRFRDFYYLLRFRIQHDVTALRRLAGFHSGWFRLPHSDSVPASWATRDADATDAANPALPLPLTKAPAPPLTGVRAPATALWKMDYVIWAFVLNTILQGVLSGFMWGYNRFTRPSWSTGLFVALACIVAGLGGYMQFREGKAVKLVEGIPVETAEALNEIEAATVVERVDEKVRVTDEKAAS